jgi:peptide/nickel transport system permease protein
MRKLLEITIRFLLSCLGIILAGGLPALLKGMNEGGLDWSGYLQSLKEIIKGIFHPWTLTYFYRGFEKPLFPNLLDLIGYSFVVLFGSFLLAAIVALLLTTFIVRLRYSVKKVIKFLFFILESIPDLFVIAIVQLLIVIVYQRTGILLADVAALGPQKIYLLPIVCLSILPSIQLFRLSIIIFEDEMEKDYVLLARSIGSSQYSIILFHVFRNAIISVFFQSKTTIWFMLSNLFILEMLFNMEGIMTFLQENLNPQVFTISLIAFFLPIYIFYSIGEWILEKKVNGGETIS